MTNLADIIETLAVSGRPDFGTMAVRVCEMAMAADDPDIDQMLRTPHNTDPSSLYVVQAPDGRVVWIGESDGGGEYLYDPMVWAREVVGGVAEDRGWDDPGTTLDEIAKNAPIPQLWGSNEGRYCAAHNEQAQAALYREIMGVGR